MVSVKEVTDDELRRELALAEQALDSGEYATSVHRSVAAYSRLIEQRPEMIIAARFAHSNAPPQTGTAGGGLVMGGPRPWPSDHGVRFTMEEGGAPSLTFSKERFTLSEAATYFEYTLDMVLRAQRRPPAGT
jgi:hypothetical protein